MQYNLSHLAQVFSHITDPRSKHGPYQPAAGILALTFSDCSPDKITSPTSADEQKETADCRRQTVADSDRISSPLASAANCRLLSAVFLAVDGKVAKQMLDEEGEVLQMLNVFVHKMKVVLWEWSVKGDKTNEPGCLKKHLGELLSQFLHLKILTGDAIFAQRPLLEVLKKQ